MPSFTLSEMIDFADFDYHRFTHSHLCYVKHRTKMFTLLYANRQYLYESEIQDITDSDYSKVITLDLLLWLATFQLAAGELL